MSNEAKTTGPTVRSIRASKWYGSVTALQEVTLDFGAGIWGLLGPNGSGKTTFLNLIAGQLRPSLGEVRVTGENPSDSHAVMRRIGFCPEADALYDDLTALEFVTAMAELTGYDRAEAKTRAAAILDVFGLTDAQDRKLGGYSRGMRQRAKIAQALVHDPDVLLLDEPLTGTDPISRQVILEEIRRRAATGTLVIFSTHVLHEVESLTDQVLLIARGQVVAQGRVEEIRSLMEEYPHHIRIGCADPRALAVRLAAVESVSALYLGAQDVTVATQRPDHTYGAIADIVVGNGIAVTSLTSPDATLEALFHHLVEHASAGAGTGADAAVGRAKSPGEARS